MKTLFKILLAPLFWLFQACSPLGDPVNEEKSNSHYYNNSKSQIRYSPMGNWFEIGNQAMKADVESFEVFNRYLSRDKENLFFEAYRVENSTVDLATFYVKNEDYMTSTGFDKDFVYAFDKVYKKGYHGVVKVAEGANPETFTRIDYDWAKDGKHHFYKNIKIVADYTSFEVLNEYFAKDKHQVFSRKNETFAPIPAILASFRTIEKNAHGIDELQIYWKPFFKNKSMGLITIPYTNIEDVKFLNRYFLTVGDTTYYDGLPMTSIDTKSFEIIDHSYSKDAKHVFYKDKVVQGADPESFRKMEKSYKYVDKNGIYHEGKLEEKEPKTTQ